MIIITIKVTYIIVKVVTERKGGEVSTQYSLKYSVLLA